MAEAKAARLNRLWLPAVLVLGLAVRLPFLPVDFGTTVDVRLLRGWAQALQTGGLVAIYREPTVNYPPVPIYFLAGAGWLEGRLGPGLDPAGREKLLTALVKLPATVADALTAWLIALAVPVPSPRRRALVAGLYLFNPAIWYVSAHWGQIDSVYALFMVASVVVLDRGRLGLAWLAGALALATKLQSLSLMPLLAIVTWQKHGLRGVARGGLVAVGAGAILAAPWLLSGEAATFLRAVIPHAPARVAVSGYNLWYLLFLGRVHEVSSLLHPAGLPVSYRQIGIGLYAAFMAFVLLAVWRTRPRSAALPAAALALGLFMLLTEVHERFMFPVLALLLLAVASTGQRDFRLAGAYALLTTTFTYNLITIAPFSPLLGTNLVAPGADSPGRVLLTALALACAAVNVAVLGWMMIRLRHARVD